MTNRKVFIFKESAFAVIKTGTDAVSSLWNSKGDGKNTVAVDIQQGTEQPYYIAKKGLRSEGVYVR